MSFYEFYHRIFGGRKGDGNRFSSTEENDNFNRDDSPWDFGGSDMRDSVFDFKVMTDPFQMHNFFEQKMNEICKSFFTPDLFPDFGDSPNVPAVEGNINPRDFYLKPEFNQTKPENRHVEENDDKGTEDSSWLSRLLPSPNQQEAPLQPRTFSSFRSVIRKTVTLPDGTIKTEEIIRNSDGTEQRTESQTLPDGSNTPRLDLPFMSPGFSGFFNHPDVPETNRSPKYDFLKPGYENFNPNRGKIDKDLDQEILKSGIESLPNFSKRDVVPEPKQGLVRSFTRRTVTLPNGVVESEEIVHNPDGTEQRTVTQTLPDQTPSSSAGLLGITKENDSNLGLSFALKGVKDLIDILFK